VVHWRLYDWLTQPCRRIESVTTRLVRLFIDTATKIACACRSVLLREGVNWIEAAQLGLHVNLPIHWKIVKRCEWKEKVILRHVNAEC
jgi:hypothetical protein